MRLSLGCVFACLVLLVCAQSLGCATVFTDTTDAIEFDSEPRGARVLIDGVERGKTPVTIPVGRDTFNDRMVTLKYDGYRPQTFVLQENFNGVTLLNVFFWPGFIVDAATGSMIKYSPNSYRITLERD